MLPKGYTIETDGEYQPGTPKYVVLLDGQRAETSWYMTPETASSAVWMGYYDKLADQYNVGRDNEIDHVLAWRLPDGRTYTADHLYFQVPLDSLEEITIAGHSFGYEIASMICNHCGCYAVEDEILDKYQLLNEGWGYGEEDEAV